MTPINFRKLATQKEVLTILTHFESEMGTSICIEDINGKPLIGVNSESKASRYPVKLLEEVIGWVIGEYRTSAIALLLSYLAQQQYEKKSLNKEELLRDIGVLLSQEASNKKVLVVDKNASTLKILTDVLQVQGYNVVKASNSQECIEKALSVQPDMIIVDSGFSQQHDLVKKLRFEKGMKNVFFVLLENN